MTFWYWCSVHGFSPTEAVHLAGVFIWGVTLLAWNPRPSLTLKIEPTLNASPAKDMEDFLSHTIKKIPPYWQASELGRDRLTCEMATHRTPLARGKISSMVALTIVRLLEFFSWSVPELCVSVIHSNQESNAIEISVYFSSTSTNGVKIVGVLLSVTHDMNHVPSLVGYQKSCARRVFVTTPLRDCVWMSIHG